ncbi:MAG: DEAD/DEAH box helicase [Acidobacteriota bacterium]|nr:DEAD/DEAH box helicase [Acidobacteriota bacterium]
MNFLPHTFDAFLSGFGRLTAIQELALEPLLNGENCVLAAATASGKTEAALAPILERYQQRRFKIISQKQTSTVKFLYIVPTRALARDIARRVEQPLKKMAIGLAVKTGDEPSLNSLKPPEFLITTPESLDSLLANRPKMLRDVRAVVLDELHLYDNTPRGDQLRILLNRLRKLRNYAFTKGDSETAEVQFCALSATMHNPAIAAAKYFANPVLIQTGGQREIDAEFFEMRGAASLRELFATFKSRAVKKVLAFCQKRAECEEWVNLLRGGAPFGDKILVHHANLSAHIRRQTEENFARAGAALCFATSTLELGIDIGDVDLILLVGAPDNLGSFLQRIGRGNRRAKRTNVACFYRTPIEEAVFQVFIRAAENSDEETTALLGSDNGLAFRPSVVVQQLCSYLKQTTHSELNPEHAYGLFADPTGEPLINKNQYDKIVEHLIEKNFFRPAMHGGKQLRAGEMWEKLYEERTLYSNLSGKGDGAVVIDDMTGRRVGYLDSKLPAGSTFLMGGHARRVTSANGRKVLTRAETDTKNVRKPNQKWNRLVKSAALIKALAKELGFPAADETGAMPLVNIQTEKDAEKRFLLFHNAGEIYGKALGELLETERKLVIVEHNEFFVEIAGTFSTTDLQISEEEIERQLNRRWKSFESAFDLGRFQIDLPIDIRRAVVVAAFNLSKFGRVFSI